MTWYGHRVIICSVADHRPGASNNSTVGTWTAAAFDRVARPGARLFQAAVGELRARRWAELNDSLGVFLPGYPITVPDERLAIDLVLDPDTAARKVRALAAQETQTAGLLDALGVDRYTAWVGDEAYVETR
jgi:hypothetical protein